MENHSYFYIFFSLIAWLHGASVVGASGTNFFGEFTRLSIFFFICSLCVYSYADHKSAAIRILIAVIYILIGGYLMAVASATAFYRNPSQVATLPDFGFELIPEIKVLQLPFGYLLNGQEVPDILFPILLIATTVFMFLRKDRLIILRRVLVIWGTLMYFRTITVLCTSVPDPSLICKNVTPGTVPFSQLSWSTVLERTFMVMLPSSVGSITCGDMIFSGHTTLLVMCAMIWHTYYPVTEKRVNVVKSVIWITVFSLVYLLVAVRMHYTIDVILGFYFTITLWNSYHRVARDVQMGMKFSTIWLIDGFIYPFIAWLENGDTDMAESDSLKNDSLNSYELLTSLCSVDPDSFKEFISRIDTWTLLRLQKEIKLCKESYLYENYKLAQTEEILVDANERIRSLSKETAILEEHLRDKDYLNENLMNRYDQYMKGMEELREQSLHLLKDNKTEECRDLLEKMNEIDKRPPDNSDNNSAVTEIHLKRQMSLLEQQLKRLADNRDELIATRFDK